MVCIHAEVSHCNQSRIIRIPLSELMCSLDLFVDILKR